MTTISFKDVYEPHDGQIEVHASLAKYKVLEIARRWGKSRCGLFELLKVYTELLDVRAPKSLIPPFHAWIVCPSFPQARQTWNELQAFLPPALVYRHPEGFKQDDKLIYLNGSEERPWGLLEVKSADNEQALQTVGLDFLWVVEAQDVSNAAFEKLAPTLISPGRAGKALYEGIPSLWSEHWFWRLYDMGLTDGNAYESFKYTAFDNPLLTDEQFREIEGYREVMPDLAWRRMYLAERSENAGYFSNINACTQGDMLPNPIPGARYVGGLDLGRKRDPTVLTIMEPNTQRVVHVDSWGSSSDWISIREAVVEYLRSWNIERVAIDASSMGGDMFTQELEALGLPLEPFIIGSALAREQLLSGLVVALERQRISFPPVPNLIRELRSFQYRKTPSGHVRAEAPPGEHDDHVFSLALSLKVCDDVLMGLAGVPSLGNMRYLPTQDEANGGGAASQGRKLMTERRTERQRHRMERAGIKP